MQTKGENLKVRILIPFLLCGLLVFWSFQATGEEFTEAQKEVWKTVQTNWEALKNADIEAYMALKHDDAAVWWGNRAHPFFNKSGEIKIQYKSWWNWDKIVSYKIWPEAIQIFNNVATVYYRVDWKGTKIHDRARIFETWIKEDNRWIQIGSLSSSCDKISTCVFSE